MITPMVASLNRLSRHLIVVLFLAVAGALYAIPGQVDIKTLDFVNADISTVLGSLATMSGANIVVSPDVKGTIPVLKLRNVTVEQALQTVAGMSGCTYRVVNGVYIFDKSDAKTVESRDNAYVIVKLQVVKPVDAISVLGGAFADVQAKGLPDDRLVLSGEIKRLQAAKAFLEEIDKVNESPKTNVEATETLYQIKAIIPWQAKAYLEDQFGQQGLSVSYAPNHRWVVATAPMAMKVAEVQKATGAENQPIATSPIGTTDQSWQSDQLILRGPKATITQALASLARIDVSVPMTEQRCSAKRIYATQAIAFLLGKYESHGLTITTAPMNFAAGDKGSTAAIGTRVIADASGKLNIAEPVGDFILSGPESVVNEAVNSLKTIDIGPERVERVYSLRFLQVADVKTRLLELYGDAGLQVTVAPSKRGDTPEVIKAEDATLGTTTAPTGDAALMKVFDLVLSGPDDIVNRAETLLQTLDIESAQIAIQTEIVSIDSSETEKLGIDWPGSVSTNLTEQPSGNALKLGRIVRDPIALTTTLNLLRSKNKAKIINQPSTVVQNGREALIHVGDKITYEVLSSISNGTPVFSTKEADTGVTLKVLPQMSKDGIITLEITSNVSELVEFIKGASGAQLPQFRETQSTTSVQIREGQTLVIAGLRQNGLITEHRGVPILGDLPLVGGLFSTKTTTPNNKEMLIMVTPHLAVAQEVTTAATLVDSEAPAK